jgi:hypothetical protein
MGALHGTIDLIGPQLRADLPMQPDQKMPGLDGDDSNF